MKQKFKNKNILVVGFGISGQAAVRFLLKEGARVAVTDIRKDFSQRQGRNIEWHLGDQDPEIFRKRDLIVLSPGVPSDLPGLKLARRLKTKIVGEFGLATAFLKAPVIAVTGTNGKSTTVTLIAHILKKAGKRVALAGNIGTPLLEIVMKERLSKKKVYDWVVAEVSSYQLETADALRPFHPRVSVPLNVTEDHLDRYRSFRDYARAKLRICRNQGPRDFLVYREEDPVLRRGVKKSRAIKISFSRRGAACCALNLGQFSQGFGPFGQGAASSAPTKLVGVHNAENIMASVAATRAVGAPLQAIEKAIASSGGLPHRTDFVREHRGVRYYDDSKGTNVDAVVKSLAGFEDRKVVLIAGGKDKGGSYAPLRDMAERKVKLVLTIGESSRKIAEALKGATEVVPAENLRKAVTTAAKKARAGDIVLLSPACSSFDQFRDYKERGDLFQKLVRAM